MIPADTQVAARAPADKQAAGAWNFVERLLPADTQVVAQVPAEKWIQVASFAPW
ncbi:hypothetical protein BN4901_3848 [Citrobacter europaeus]|uniref:Uncharacterized protein n=1 Tax=Citrobacter europaeus TaxID=1914243 RepID=A0ABY0JTI5_9ENTR|nr:hypothetical protein CIP106467_3467 [Citrobacter europaeus]SBW27286.1 hypothetical protein BN4901_3848 [Citrobacter europaeus]